MYPYAPTPADRDPNLWRLAKRRAKFKAHLFTFLWVNILLWAIWALTDRSARPVPWPVWVTAFWGLGVVLQAIATHGAGGRGGLAEREYERLTRPR
ncbi:2TM domain-containing protein [Hymenobacter sp. RP-2-7]|uniref:2TM domain-containing protein n=1 Tax=Hymenobacter polaris TaxID=2682546 RepID=A0A7Y0AIB1_9BACT|nr:2TM domain-containing protein [Hymenobacter polaris]NML67825.1 2TM domain-containing protein [Hymenobacter polaris]